MSYTFELDPENVLEFYPSGLINTTNMIKASYRTYSGKGYNYKKGTYTAIEFTLDFVSAADAATINGWHESGTILNATFNDMEYKVRIMGDTQPLDSHEPPYIDYYHGTVTIETIDNEGFVYLLDSDDKYLLGSGGDYLAVKA